MRDRIRVFRGAAAVLMAASVAAGCDPKSNVSDAGRPAPDAVVKADQGPPKPDVVVDNGDATAIADVGPDAGTDAALGDSGALAPDPGQAAPALFGPDAPGATALDAPIAAVIDAWQTLPTDEPTAQAYVQGLQGALSALREQSEAAADRITEVCAEVPVQAAGPTMLCLRLLAVVESPRSLDLLTERARTPVPAWPQDAHPVDPPPEGLARQVAFRSLGLRVRGGSTPAADLLIRLAADPDPQTRGQATAEALSALPRALAKARLRAVLPAAEHYRLYQTR